MPTNLFRTSRRFAAIEDDMRAKIQAAIRELGAEPCRESVLLQRRIADTSALGPFEGEGMGDELAHRAGYFLKRVVRQDRRGYEHALLLCRKGTLKGQEGIDPTERSVEGEHPFTVHSRFSSKALLA